jgi:proline racemase
MRSISVVGAHAGGEIGNVVVGGVLPPPGATVFEQMQALERDGDALRRLLLREPRGSVAVHANLVVPATRDDCDAGFIIMEPTEYPPMSGSNTICVVTVLLETGMLPMREPETVVRLEAPGGVVEARAVCRAGRCESVEFTNVPCFAERLDAPLEVEGLGTLTVDVAYGGMYHCIADAAALGFAITADEAASCRSPASGSASRHASSCPASTRRTTRSATSRSSRSQPPGGASERLRATPSSSRRAASTAARPAPGCAPAWRCCTRAG